MIWFESTQRTVLVGCVQCGCREICTTKAAADRWAHEHIYRAHPAPDHEHMQAITAARKRRQRAQ